MLHADFGKRWEFVTNQNEIINGKTHDDLKEEYKKDKSQWETDRKNRGNKSRNKESQRKETGNIEIVKRFQWNKYRQ